MPSAVNIPRISAPAGADIVAEQLRTQLQWDADNSRGLPWLDAVYGIARKVSLTDPRGREQIVPACYYGQQEYQPLQMSDQLRGFAFQLLDDPQEFEHQLPTPAMRYEMALIVVANMRRINNSAELDYHFEQQLIGEVSTTLIRRGPRRTRMELRQVSSQTPEAVFREFTITDAVRACFMHPYCAFRLDFSAMVEQCFTSTNLITNSC